MTDQPDTLNVTLPLRVAAALSLGRCQACGRVRLLPVTSFGLGICLDCRHDRIREQAVTETWAEDADA